MCAASSHAGVPGCLPFLATLGNACTSNGLWPCPFWGVQFLRCDCILPTVPDCKALFCRLGSMASAMVTPQLDSRPPSSNSSSKAGLKGDKALKGQMQASAPRQVVAHADRCCQISLALMPVRGLGRPAQTRVSRMLVRMACLVAMAAGCARPCRRVACPFTPCRA